MILLNEHHHYPRHHLNPIHIIIPSSSSSSNYDSTTDFPLIQLFYDRLLRLLSSFPLNPLLSLLSSINTVISTNHDPSSSGK